MNRKGIVTGILLLTALFSGNAGSGEDLDLSYDKNLEKIYRKPYTIEAYFMMLPPAVIKMDTAARKQLLKTKSYGCTTLRLIDYRGGFMEFGCSGDGGSESTEITYWILSDGSRLVGVNKTTGGMCCDTSQAMFFTFDSNYDINVWSDETSRVFPSLKLRDFMKKDSLGPDEMERMAPVLIKLPRKGLDIIVSLAGEYADGSYHDRIENLKIIMKWNDGKFIIGGKLK